MIEKCHADHIKQYSGEHSIKEKKTNDENDVKTFTAHLLCARHELCHLILTEVTLGVYSNTPILIIRKLGQKESK